MVCPQVRDGLGTEPAQPSNVDIARQEGHAQTPGLSHVLRGGGVLQVSRLASEGKILGATACVGPISPLQPS